ncbi:ABC transporter ATP-binding protein [Microbacterium thalli]|uniref:ATP-binding cassette domain-containing protein n=1 Tax=Microbacterium thalli TaxID=3027921 RepID=A0ABT5SHF5_9MICO|nr:ATP-binding cassette domain-containing protein [Microbacterium thalli]MDD7930393.1 ATP-binding cassette domain-containing protein [Microbacterium thalli]MDD7962224.1 ATP-binding cassette domain-containing protein [Microbacterium thalli]MDN8548307.1 ATP-binding cassette domain-containing protein [Microbacterium thalli]
MTTEPLITARGLTRRYRTRGSGPWAPRRETVALDDVDVDVRPGSALGIIGESGSGKSTLVRLLLGLDTPSAGSVTIDGRSVDARASARSLHWLRRRTGIVFQDPYASLDPRMSVGRIVGEPLWALGVDGDRRARVREVLTDVGLDPEAADRYPHEFSGGQRQRIALARAIVHGPDILVGDEPLSALDVTVRAQILDVLRELRERHRMTLLLVSHDIGVVQNLCDEVVVMTEGRIVEEGPTEKVLLQPQAAYTRRLLASVPVIDPHRAAD